MSAPAGDVRARAGWWAAGALFLLLSILIAVRALLVDRSVGVYIACPGCFHLDVFLADLVTFAALASQRLEAWQRHPARADSPFVRDRTVPPGPPSLVIARCARP